MIWNSLKAELTPDGVGKQPRSRIAVWRRNRFWQEMIQLVSW